MAKERRVFVTGSTGCIGTHAVDLMIEEGAEVFGFNRSAPVNRLKNSHYHHLEGDLVDRETLQTALKEVRPTHILHLGALQTPDCRDYPMRGMQVNLMGRPIFLRPVSICNCPWNVLYSPVRVP